MYSRCSSEVIGRLWVYPRQDDCGEVPGFLSVSSTFPANCITLLTGSEADASLAMPRLTEGARMGQQRASAAVSVRQRQHQMLEL